MQRTSKCKCIDLDLLNPSEFYGHFVFTELEQSESDTIANMLRRVLLSSLYGIRITGVRVPGMIKSEFIPLEGVREDFLEIMLNLKEVILEDRNKISNSYLGILKIQGPAIVTAGTIILPPGVNILNPTTHLFTISDESTIELELKIEHGKSYVLARDQKLEGSTDYIPLDSSFAPVLKVNSYTKLFPQDNENTNEELHLEIFTNGTLLPHQALLQARNMLGYLLSPIKNIEFPCFNGESLKDSSLNKDLSSKREEILGEYKTNNSNARLQTLDSTRKMFEEVETTIHKEQIEPETTNLNEQASQKAKTPEEVLLERVIDMESGSLESLGLSNRIIKILNKSNINFTWDLMQYDSPDPPYLIDIKGLGPKSVNEIKEKLKIFYEPPY